MERLSPLDAAFLDAEDEDRHASLAIASVAIMDGTPPTQEEFAEAVRGRLPLVPRYRQKVRQIPLDLGQPVWVDDAHFDLGYHLRRTALVKPGDDAALSRLVARIMSQRLDRDRPLWECWVIEGLPRGRWAVLSKVHHCLADGISGNELYRVLFDESPEPGTAVEDHWQPEPEPGTASLLLDAVADLVASPVEQARMAISGLRSPARLARRIADTASGLAKLAGALVPVTKTSLAGPIGQQRRYGVARADLHDIVEVAKACHVTVNDVVLAAIAGAFRSLLLHQSAGPDPRAVRSLVPVSVRARGDEGRMDNRISLMLPLLPVEVAEPLTRLAEVHRRLAILKWSKEAEAGEAMTTLARHEPFAPISWGIRLAAHIPQRNIVTVTTNVPGPRQPLYILGRRIVEILPYVPIAVRLRTGIAMLTYGDQMAVGVTSDYDTGPDPAALADAISDGIAELVAAVRDLGDVHARPGRRRAPKPDAAPRPTRRPAARRAAPTPARPRAARGR